MGLCNNAKLPGYVSPLEMLIGCGSWSASGRFGLRLPPSSHALRATTGSRGASRLRPSTHSFGQRRRGIAAMLLRRQRVNGF